MTHAQRQGGKFGRKPYDPQKPNIILQARHFPGLDVESAVPAAPPSRDNLGPLKEAPGGMPMYGNDEYGDCVWAMIGHDIQLKTLLGPAKEVTVATEALLKGYSDVTGFDPNDPNTDEGTNMQDAFDYWRKTGIKKPDGTYDKILAFAEVPHTNRALLTEALNIFGSLLIGVNFPQSAMDQFNEHKPWTVIKGSPIEGGHAVIVGSYALSGSTMDTEIGTWAAEQEVTDAWWMKYVEEAWVVVTGDWMNAGGKTAQNFDWAELEKDFVALTGAAPFPEPVPNPDPNPSPTPEPTPTPDPVPPTPVGWNSFVTESETWLSHHHTGQNATFARYLSDFLKANEPK